MTTAYRTPALVIQSAPFGDYDRFVTLLTRDFGKLACVAHGANRPTSRLAPHLALSTESEVAVVFGRRYPLLVDAQGLSAYTSETISWVRLSFAAALARLCDRALTFTMKQSELYSVLAETFRLFHRALHEATVTGEYLFSSSLLAYGAMQLARYMGHSPYLSRCAVCGRVCADEKLFFSFQDGGAIHLACRQGRRLTGYEISSAVKEALERYTTRYELPKDLTKRDARLLREVSCGLVLYMIEDETGAAGLAMV